MSRCILHAASLSLDLPHRRSGTCHLCTKAGMPGHRCHSELVSHGTVPVQARGYAVKDQNLQFSPTPLGEALIGAYDRMGLKAVYECASGPTLS